MVFVPIPLRQFFWLVIGFYFYKVVPEPKGLADNLDELATDLGKVNFIDKNGVEKKIVEIDEMDEDEETMMAPSEADIDRVKRMMRLGGKWTLWTGKKYSN